MTTEENIKYLRDWLHTCRNDKGEVRTFSWAYAKGMLAIMQANMLIDEVQYYTLYKEIRQFNLDGKGEK